MAAVMDGSRTVHFSSFVPVPITTTSPNPRKRLNAELDPPAAEGVSSLLSSRSYSESLSEADSRIFVHSWTIANCDLLNETPVSSKPFPEDNLDYGQWCIKFCPVAMLRSPDFVSVYLCLLKCEEKSIWAKCSFFVLDSGGRKVLLRRDSALECFALESEKGFEQFFKRSELFSGNPAYSSNNELHFRCEVTVRKNSYLSYDKSNEAIKIPECTLLDDFWAMFSDKMSTDVLLIVGKAEFPAHKAVLSARCLVFAAMFQHQMSEKTRNSVIIEDIYPEVMLEVLRFIYTGRVENIKTHAKDLLIAADRYDLRRLKLMCENSMACSLSPDTVGDTLLVAETYRAIHLRSYVVKYVGKNKDRVIQSPGWKHLMTSDPDIVAKALQEVLADFAVA